MRVYRSLEEVGGAPARGRVAAIGVFDGVHRGHQRILQRAVEHGRAIGATVTAVTFHPHPDAVLRKEGAPPLLTTLERKAFLLAELGLDEMVVVTFDAEFSQLSPQAFCERVLSSRLGVRAVYVGENFRFGHRGEGTAEHLEVFGAVHGFAVYAIELARDDGDVISSTRIRQLLNEGQVEEAARLLGRPHRVEGLVVPGAGRGRTLSAPTANVRVDGEVALPRPGVYVSRSTVDGKFEADSITSVGTNPTFGGQELTVETLLLDFSGNLYRRWLAVDFLERIREQAAFSDANELAKAIRRDIEVARQAHARLRGQSREDHGPA
ncbi:MAG: bifunctional riboflavin kinase/FAD synthetase [Thermoleophilia bacterium]|nr:bifunctional riboflavin kinase/FAD synthetase [Thermoleophilia bacterium]